MQILDFIRSHKQAGTYTYYVQVPACRTKLKLFYFHFFFINFVQACNFKGVHTFC